MALVSIAGGWLWDTLMGTLDTADGGKRLARSYLNLNRHPLPKLTMLLSFPPPSPPRR